MSLNTASRYKSLRFTENKKQVFYTPGPYESEETFDASAAAGMLVGFTAWLYYSVGGELLLEPTAELESVKRGKNVNVYYDREISYKNALGGYYLDSALRAEITSGNHKITPKKAEDMFWWISTDGNNEEYGLYSFGDASFIEGFIYICDVLGIDFRFFALGPPFTIELCPGRKFCKYTFLTVSGYDIPPFPSNNDSIEPFFTNAYEADASGVDYE